MAWLSPLITHTTAFRDQGQQCLLGRLIYGTQVLGLGRGWVVSLNIKISDFSLVVLVSCCRSSLFSQNNAWGSLEPITQWILSAINHPRTPYTAWKKFWRSSDGWDIGAARHRDSHLQDTAESSGDIALLRLSELPTSLHNKPAGMFAISPGHPRSPEATGTSISWLNQASGCLDCPGRMLW